MPYSINNTQTVWLPFNTKFTATTTIAASWNQLLQVSDPNNLTNYTNTGNGNTAPKVLGAFTTPASYGQFTAYPVNVRIMNDGGNGGTPSKPSYVISEGWSVTSWDQINGKNNVFISFQPNL